MNKWKQSGDCKNYNDHVNEMAKIIYSFLHSDTMSRALASLLCGEGYRKQSEGEWIKTETNYTCSKCNFNVISWSGEYDGYECERGISLMKFCPNCGAKMKGGTE